MNYDPQLAPTPATNPDWYANAMVVELRLIRMQLEKLTIAVGQLTTAMQAKTAVPHTGKK